MFTPFGVPLQHALRESRAVDDKIIQALNNVIPTQSLRGQVDVAGKCRELWQGVSQRGHLLRRGSHASLSWFQIERTYASREKAIHRCVGDMEKTLAKHKADGDRGKARQCQVTVNTCNCSS